MNQHTTSLSEMFHFPAFDSPEAEEQFWVKSDREKFAFRKFFLFIAILTFAAIGTLDPLTGGQETGTLLAIRGGTLIVLSYLYSQFCEDRTHQERDRLILWFGTACGISIITMTLIAPRPAADFYPFLLAATIIFGSALITPRFRTMARLCIGTNLVYWPTTYFSATSEAALYANVFVLLVTSFSAVFGAYTREKLEREQALNEVYLADAREQAYLSRDAAVQANRAKSHLLANVSHELRTPMNAILGFSEIIRQEMFGRIPQAQYRDYIDDIYNSGTLLQSSINDLLDVSRLEVDKMTWIDDWVSLDGVIERTLSTCQHAADDASITLTHQREATDTAMLCDPDRMAQILINLVTNAIKFSDKGSAVSVGISSKRTYHVLSVTDQGRGIQAEDVDRICEPFGQVERDSYDSNKAGLGLGLSIVQGLAKKFGGIVEIDSTVGVGTTVSLLIPIERIRVTRAVEGRIRRQPLALAAG